MDSERPPVCLNECQTRQHKKKRMNRLNIRQTKRKSKLNNVNSDSEFPTTSILVENASSRCKPNRIVLEDPYKLIMRRKQENEIRKDMHILDGSPAKCHQADAELENLVNEFDKELHQPEIKPFPPGRHTFLTRRFLCMFSKDTIPGEDDLSVEQLMLVEKILNTETREILHYLRDTWAIEQLNSVCDYIFSLVAVHDNKMLINKGAVCLNETTFWYPKLDNILMVLLNWGASVMGDVRCTAERFPNSYSAPIFIENCKQILQIVSIKAEQIMKHITEEKECILLKSIINGALDVHCIYSCPSEFRTCVTALVNAIPDYRWNPRKVQMICQSLHTTDDVHNLYYVCAEILTARPRCEQIGHHLASLTAHRMLDLNFNDKIMDFLVNSKPFIQKLNLYQLYLMNQLVFLLTKREKEVNNNVDLPRIMEWFEELKRCVKECVNQKSLDCTTTLALISRCVDYWHIEVTRVRVHV